MKKRIRWRENDVVNIKLKENLYTIGQMHVDPYMIFFKISNKDGKWNNVNLNKIEQLFCISIGVDFIRSKVIEKLYKGIISKKPVIFPKNWIRPNISTDSDFIYKGGELIEFDPKEGYYYANVIKENLTKEDTKIIKESELVNMWGDEDLTERLTTYFETKIDKDPFKEKVFRDII